MTVYVSPVKLIPIGAQAYRHRVKMWADSPAELFAALRECVKAESDDDPDPAIWQNEAVCFAEVSPLTRFLAVEAGAVESKAPGPVMGDPGHCRTCHARIVWIVTEAGRKMPVNLDGVSHFATCKHAKEWRRDK